MLKRMFKKVWGLPRGGRADRSQMGFIEQAEIIDGNLVVAGWLGSEDDGMLRTVEIGIDQATIVGSKLTKMLPSTDVAKAHPHLSGATNCRFNIVAPLSSTELIRKQKDALISLTPVFEHGVGRTVFYPLDLTVPLPGCDLVEGIGGGYVRVAFDYLSHFVQLGYLDESDCVLDVGCGCGRMAVALSLFLKDTSRYEGFDIVVDQVQWAQKNISTRYSHFNFQRVDVFNKYYNPTGILDPVGFSFPYEANTFDFAFLTSVFTHMQAPELQHYLRELYRVLKPGKTCFVTAFLLNDESLRLIATGKSSIALVHGGNGCRIADPLNPEGAVGFAELDLFQWCEKVGFKVSPPHYGKWCGRERYVDYQDILILTK